jgi:phospholipid N-methyltransferase
MSGRGASVEGNGKAVGKRSTRSVDFFRGFLRSPENVGSVIPSSRFLERRLIRLAGLDRADIVVELGPGTGGTTRAILAAMPESARLLTIELDPQFSEILEAIGDPRLIPHTGSAVDLARILADHGLDRPDVVISGIPFSTMPREIGRAIIAAVRDNLAPGGRFVAYQFRGAVGRLGQEVIGAPEVELEMLNIPPMRFYTWRV